jgi:glycosyltransferase involved in cell wall biosynthesis
MVIHTLHSFYGKENLPGGRSRRIAESSHRTRDIQAFALLKASKVEPEPGVVVHRVIDSVKDRAERAFMVRLMRRSSRLRYAAGQFDRLTARRVAEARSTPPDVLHTWNWLPRTIETARRANPQVTVIRDVAIAREHDYETGVDIRSEADHVDLFLSPSSYVTDQLRFWGIRQDQIREIPFGVDTETFRPVSDVADNPVRFAFVGAVSARKGVPSLLRAWKSISLPDAELHLYGTLKPEVRPWLDGAAGVTAHGYTPVEDKLPYHHVFVFPSTREGSSKAVYEAMACGLPVITTGNAGSIARDGLDGIIVEPDDDDALAAAMERLHADPGLRAEMGRNAREQAERYPWERYARSVWQVYESAIARSR